MQTIQNPNPGSTQIQPGNVIEGQKAFAEIPTRISDLTPPLVVGNETDESVKQQVVESLSHLEVSIAVVHRESAEAYISQGLYEQALPHLRAAVTFAPGNMEYVNQYGFVQFVTGDDKGAVDSFQAVLADNPQQVDSLFNLGMVLFGLSDFVNAEECFRRVLEITPQDAETWNNRGACLFQSGRTQDAATCFQQALQIDPNHADASANLASC